MPRTLWKISTLRYEPPHKPYEGVVRWLREGRAIFGWSNRDELDLRRLRERLQRGEDLSALDMDAAAGMPFLERVENEDLLVYANQNSKGWMYVVEVTGPYKYSERGHIENDFRSYRPCLLLTKLAERMPKHGMPARGRIAEITTARDSVL